MTGGPGPLVRVVGAKRQFHDHIALAGVDLMVERGEVVVLIGPSGSGKTTLLRSIALLETLTDGAIWFDGELHGYREEKGRYAPLPESKLISQRRRVGMVFQHFNLFPHKTALQNVSIAPVHVLGRNRAEVEDEAHALLARVRLEGKANRYPSQLSGGEQQRVAICRALAMKPRLLLFDEPTSALDAEMVSGVLETMTSLARDGMTMVVASHEIGFAREVAHRMVFMDGGRIVDQGPPGHFLTEAVDPRVRAFLDKIL